jgi:hypothetical protein
VTDAGRELARWLGGLGADVERSSARLSARVEASPTVARAWRIERASLLVRYVDRRCDDRRLTCELTRVRADVMRANAASMRRAVAAMRSRHAAA